MSATPWDDERLGAAFTAMARMHPAPADLVSATSNAVATPRRTTFTMRWAVAGMALVVGMIVVIGGGILGYQAFRPVLPAGASPATGQVATTSPASGAPTAPSGTPGSSNPLLALPIIGVGDAIAVRDGGIDDRQIAVRGWYQNGGPVPCPSNPAVVNPLQPDCPDDRVWLTRDPETLFLFQPDGGETARQPTGAALNPDFDVVDPASWGLLYPTIDLQPVELVMVGHFDDPLSATCPTESMQACRDQFVVDQVWTPDGKSMLDQTRDGATVIPTITVSDAITIRDNGTDGHEIAVRGFYSDNSPTPCMDRLGPIAIHPLQMTCFDEYVWLLEYPERLPVVASRSGMAPQPAGPGLHPYLGRLGQRWTTDGVTPSHGVDVVMVGHFDDHEAASCPKPSRQACRDRFVVDQVWSGDRTALLASTSVP